MSKYHDILGVSEDASKDEIKKAYRKAAAQAHPDKGGSDEEFQTVHEAYERLTNPQKFAHEHHQYHHDPFGGVGPNERFWHHVNIHNFEDLLRRHQQTAAIKLQLDVELESTLHEQTRTIHVPEYNIPPFEITIPAGVRHGDTMRYSNIPSTDQRVPNRNLIIVFMIRPHKEFRIAEDVHLVKTDTVNALDAMVGTSIEVKTLEGTTLNVKVPAGTQNGQKLKIPQKGLKYKEDPNFRGDLYVEVLITIPHLSNEEQKIITELLKKRKK